MKLRVTDAVFLFVLGAAAALVGDHSHVVTGTTEYLSHSVPFVWSSPIWFPILVAVATVVAGRAAAASPGSADLGDRTSGIWPGSPR